MEANQWDLWVEEAVSKLKSNNLLRSLRPINLSHKCSSQNASNGYEYFDTIQEFDRKSVEYEISDTTYDKWLLDISSCGDDIVLKDVEGDDSIGGKEGLKFKKLILFSGNDYLGLSSHPTIIKAAMEAAQEHGMGPRGSALISGYTNYHRLLESSLADLKKKEDCLLCPTGFSANMAFMTALGNIASLLAKDDRPSKDERVAIFSDALNHASIIDGIRLAQKLHTVETFVYRHCDMAHLDSLLSSCLLKKKIVISDSLFSMDGDFAPMVELVKLREKHKFLFVIDDAHATFVCGNTGGGAAEMFNCEKDVDICIGTLSKAAGCHGGFIACSQRWKIFIQSRGRSFIFSTSIPVPMVAAANAAITVSKREMWRRKAIWKRVQDFHALTGITVTSPIISLIVGNEEKALQASRHLLKSGFHVTAIRPPTVAPNSCRVYFRLRVVLSAAHTLDDLRKFTTALSHCINFQDRSHCTNGYAKL
ncbi:hypothetical protein Leryth_009834 [Lithospermum erythrorhizon]|nr:hypothetical protein Leryth_009834 [Lithospermum erythrorhizon]